MRAVTSQLLLGVSVAEATGPRPTVTPTRSNWSLEFDSMLRMTSFIGAPRDCVLLRHIARPSAASHDNIHAQQEQEESLFHACHVPLKFAAAVSSAPMRFRG